MSCWSCSLLHNPCAAELLAVIFQSFEAGVAIKFSDISTDLKHVRNRIYTVAAAQGVALFILLV